MKNVQHMQSLIYFQCITEKRNLHQHPFTPEIPISTLLKCPFLFVYNAHVFLFLLKSCGSLENLPLNKAVPLQCSADSY